MKQETIGSQDALDCQKMGILIFVYTVNIGMIMGAWAGYQWKNGT